MGELFKKNFRFTGGEIVNEFLMSTVICLALIKKNAQFLQKKKQKLKWMDNKHK